MSPPRELELKLDVPAHSLATLTRSSLLRAAGKTPYKPSTLVSVYFDTDKLKLRNKGLSLRVRRADRRHEGDEKWCLGNDKAVAQFCRKLAADRPPTDLREEYRFPRKRRIKDESSRRQAARPTKP